MNDTRTTYKSLMRSYRLARQGNPLQWDMALIMSLTTTIRNFTGKWTLPVVVSHCDEVDRRKTKAYFRVRRFSNRYLPTGAFNRWMKAN